VQIAIESVLEQANCDFELVVVNDGSTDASWATISKYSEKITAINTENRGFIAACLTGLSASHGQYILFLDADDVLGKDALQTVSRHIEPDVAKVQFMLQPIDAQGAEIGDAFPRLPADYGNRQMIASINRLGFYPTPPTSGNIYRRDVYLTLGSIDYDFGIDGVAYLIAPFKGKVVHLDEVLGRYRIHGQNMSGFGSSSHLRMEKERRVFRLRLEHLDTLIRKDPLAQSEPFLLKPDYLYAVERDVFAEILRGKRLRLAAFWRYYRQINTSFAGVERVSYSVFAVLLFVFPNSVARSLMEFSINPKKNSVLRTTIKRIVRG
jgi:glycosyltransferase involved in cell wall biosynthesis